ncbi:MAG TPA: hypothetical protein VGD69_07075 [Herpetosiphonaceae bacterium]
MSHDESSESRAARLFVRPDFDVPTLFETEYFRLRPLTVADVDNDYAALMSSIPLLNSLLGWGWPREDFTREENLVDLAAHEQQFIQRVAFAYTVVAPDESSCLGCLYINPPQGQPVDARVYMWVRQSAYDQGLDPILFRTVKDWIAERWPFTNVSYPGRDENGAWLPRPEQSE